jgi:hypothetical protein
MFHAIISATLFLISSACFAGDRSFKSDLDADGIKDTIQVKRTPKGSDSIRVDIKINFSSGAPAAHFSEIMDVQDASSFSVYSRRGLGGYLVFDYTNRGTRQPTDFYYDVYKWNPDNSKLCLYKSVSGVPKDQLAGEVFDSSRFVTISNDCFGIETSGGGGGEAGDNSYYKKSEIFAKISIAKARLYDVPNDQAHTKIYLIRNDKVTIIEYKYDKGIDWFLVNYFPKGKTEPIKKWIRGEAID